MTLTLTFSPEHKFLAQTISRLLGYMGFKMVEETETMIRMERS